MKRSWRWPGDGAPGPAERARAGGTKKPVKKPVHRGHVRAGHDRQHERPDRGRENARSGRSRTPSAPASRRPTCGWGSSPTATAETKYVTRSLPLTDDLDKVFKDPHRLLGGRGGDGPDRSTWRFASPAQGEWSPAESLAVKIIFLVATRRRTWTTRTR